MSAGASSRPSSATSTAFPALSWRIRSVRNPVARVTAPSSTALAARIPRAPRSGSSSVALPAVAALAVARRSAQVTRVPGFARAMRASSMTAVAAEWPAPRTTVCLPANGSGAAKSGIWYLTRPSSRGGALAEGGQPVRAGRVRLPPRARRVDDRPRVQLALVPVLAGDVHGERLVAPARVDQAVAALARHPGHPVSVQDPAAERLRERAQVPRDPLGAGRVALARRRPPAGREQARRRLVDQFRPRREQPDVPPLGDGGRGAVAGLQHQRLKSPLEQVRGGGEPLRARADHHDGQFAHHRFLPFTFLDASNMLDASRKVNRTGKVRPWRTPALPLLIGDLAACCSPLTGGALDEEAAERIARVFRALGDRHRVRLLSLIAAADGGEACICDLTAPVGLSQPTVSFHMKQLVEAGLVTREQRGKWNYYRVVPEALLAASELLRAPAA